MSISTSRSEHKAHPSLDENSEYIRLYATRSGRAVSGRMAKTGVNGQTFFLSDDGILMSARCGNGVTLYERKLIALYLSANDLESLRKLDILTTASLKEAKAVARQHAADVQRRRDLDDLQRIQARLKPRTRTTSH